MVARPTRLAPIWALAAAAVALVLPLSQGPQGFNPVRVLLYLPLVLFWPGYALLAVAGLRGDRITRIALAVGLSLALCVPIGILLNLVGWLGPKGWISALAAVTLAGWWFSRKAPAAPPSPGPRVRVSRSAAAGFAGALVLAVAAVLLARGGALAHREFRFTEFWMVPENSVAKNLVTIGVGNDEGEASRYEVDLMLDGVLVGQLPAFELADRDRRTFRLALTVPANRNSRIEAWLYRNGARGVVYRKVWLASPAFPSASRQGD